MGLANHILTKVKTFKERINTKKPVKPVTALEEVNEIIRKINKIAYAVGFELTDDYRFNNRTMFTVMLKISVILMESSSLYIQYPTLACIPLIGGMAFTCTVRIY